MPTAEVILWAQLQKKQLYGYKFRRQQGIGRYIVDFYCARAKLVIEIDGDSHFQPGVAAYDLERQKFIESLGFTVIRFINTDIYENLSGVLDVIIKYLDAQ